MEPLQRVTEVALAVTVAGGQPKRRHDRSAQRRYACECQQRTSEDSRRASAASAALGTLTRAGATVVLASALAASTQFLGATASGALPLRITRVRAQIKERAIGSRRYRALPNSKNTRQPSAFTSRATPAPQMPT